ncbi:uncharacterized protein TRIADDRAFT_60201 [Trichoplax adhaerens]|uniref:C2 domain-containing protein n=1 Tax=Trichoplax adhaerens TaxID=10228 RepID=B3S7K7_TRIAD|nr:predicted protein [Trichoplax adhaerens]EDV21214.1 predicted protein [Trichoplax adhaerens]|eukprot:XP_002116181.1 predicted protein [Trichoplax adhaerens]
MAITLVYDDNIYVKLTKYCLDGRNKSYLSTSHQCGIRSSDIELKIDRLHQNTLPPTIESIKSISGARDAMELAIQIKTDELGFIINVSSKDYDNVLYNVLVKAITTKAILQLIVIDGCLNVRMVMADEFEAKIEVRAKDLPEDTISEHLLDSIRCAVKDVVLNAVPTVILKNPLVTSPPINSQFKFDQLKSRRESLRTVPVDGRIIITVISACGLIAKHNHGHSCPYCVIKMDSTVYRTKIVRLTADPVFNEHFVFETNSKSGDITFDMYSSDTLAKDTFLGRTSVSLLAIQASEGQMHAKLPLSGLKPNDNITGYLNVEYSFKPVVAANGSAIPTNKLEIPPRSRRNSQSEVSICSSYGGIQFDITDTSTKTLAKSEIDNVSVKSQADTDKNSVDDQEKDKDRHNVDYSQGIGFTIPKDRSTGNFLKRAFSTRKKKVRDSTVNSNSNMLSKPNEVVVPDMGRPMSHTSLDKLNKGSIASSANSHDQVSVLSNTSSINKAMSKLSYSPNGYSSLVMETTENDRPRSSCNIDILGLKFGSLCWI